MRKTRLKAGLLCFSLLWITELITIDLPPERIKCQGKKESSLLWNQDDCIHGSNALCNFHHISIEQLCRTLSRTNLKEYSLIFSQNIMYADLETHAY